MRNSLILSSATFLVGTLLGVTIASAPHASASSGRQPATVHYLEIVTRDVDAVVAAYTASLDVQFSEPEAALGGARTVSLPGGGLLGVRGPLRDDEEPIVRPYWLVPDIEAAVDAVVAAGGQVAHPPLEIPGYGTFAIYYQAGNDHGLWQLNP